MDLSINKLPWHGQLLVFVCLAAAGVAAFYYVWVVPAQTGLAERSARLAQVQADIAKGRQTAEQLEDFREEVTALERRLDGLKAVLPDQKDVGDLLRRIQTLAAQSNLTITGFRPMATAVQELHVEWPIALQLDGTYHNLGAFFDRIGHLSRIINIGAIEIRAKAAPEPNSTVSAECTATTFVLLDDPGDGTATADAGDQGSGGQAAARPPQTGAQSG